MSRLKRGYSVWLATVALALATAGCGASGSGADDGQASGQPQKGGVVSYAVPFETPSMDPALCGSLVGFTYCSPVFSTLMRYDSDSRSYVPELAESLKSDDGQNWTLRLRNGVKFSDGQPLNADAVLFNWDRIRNPATASPAAAVSQTLTWTKTDDLTIQIQTKTPNFQLPSVLVTQMGSIGSPAAIQAAGQDVGNKPVGAGAFLMKTWTRGSQMEFSANPTYWQAGRPYVDGLVIGFVPSDDQRFNVFESGALDVNYSVQWNEIPRAKDIPDTSIQPVPIEGGASLAFNLNDPVVQDQGLRQAIMHALDASQVTAAAYPGSPVPDALLKSDNPARDDAAGVFPSLDLSQAQNLFDDYLRRTGKTSESISITSYADVPVQKAASEVMQQQISQIRGLTVKLQPVDVATLTKAQRERSFQIIQGNATVDTLDRMYDLFHTGGALNFYNYSNPVVDKAMEESRAAKDPDQALKAYTTAAGEISKNGPLRFYRWVASNVLYHNDVHGIVAVPTTALMGIYWENVWLSR